MRKASCFSEVGLTRGPWSAKEDKLLINYVRLHGEGHWRHMPKKAGLLRCGKSCRLRWMNYLRPDIKRGNIASDEEDLIIKLHSLLGNRWSLIAKRLPGRTDNEIKNYWNSHLSKRLKETKTATDPSEIKRANDHDEELTAKTKLYVPKAIRVSAAFPCSITRRSASGLVSSSTGEGNSTEAKEVNADFVVPEGNNMPDEIFEEYQQQLHLLEDQVQLNFFADSLLL